MLKYLFTFFIAACTVTAATGQTAMDEFKDAKTALENGSVDACLRGLARAEAALGGSNPKIMSLKCQALVEKRDWIAAGIAYKNFERMIPAANRNGEKYEAMLQMKQTIDAGLAELERLKKEEKEKEIKEDLRVADNEAESDDRETESRLSKINAVNEKQLYNMAMQTKDKTLLEVYKEEVGTKGSNYEKVAKEVKKHENPNEFIGEAAERGDEEEVKYLLGLGADKNYTSSKGGLLHFAVKGRQYDMTKYLLSLKPNLELKNSEGETALFPAVTNGFNDGVTLLLEAGANAKATSYEGQSVLWRAVVKKNTGAIAPLVNHGADLREHSALRGMDATPLYYATFYFPHEPMVRALLDAGAKVDDVSEGSWTPLMGAIYQNNTELAELLLARKADINKQGPHKWTAMHIAVRNHNVSTIQFLLNHGASYKIADEWKRTALKVAKERRYKDVIKVLKQS